MARPVAATAPRIPAAADLAFGRAVVAWFKARARDLPWRRRRDPWAVWVSEVMLQQTTADVVAARFDAFLRRFPSPDALAAASEADVLAAWAGLGYYRRARFLRAGAAAAVAAGGLPRTVEGWRRLPGVGEYTAGAVASLAFGERAPAVDGNVARVLSRFEDSALDPASSAGRKALNAAALRLMPPEAPGPFNEGLIELGATVCRPARPACDACPLADGCLGRERGTAASLPKLKARPSTIAVTSVRAVVRQGARILVARRPADASLLPDFDELPGAWVAADDDPAPALDAALRRLGFHRPQVGAELARARHAITRHRITAVAFAVRAAAPVAEGADGTRYRFVPPSALKGDSVTTETRKLARAFASVAFHEADS